MLRVFTESALIVANHVQRRKLLFSVAPSECHLDTFTVGGHGGSGKDTSNTGVRWTHLPSGAVGESREFRSQQQNKEAAWKRMGQSKAFQTWARMQAAKIMGQPSIDDLVDQEMTRDKLKVEVREGQEWRQVEN